MNIAQRIVKVIKKKAKTANRSTVAAMASLGILAAAIAYVTAPSGNYSASVVKVLNTAGTGGGTGWAARTNTGRKVIITNDHVCDVAEDGVVRIDDDRGTPSMKQIIKRSYLRDLCVIDGLDIPTLSLAPKPPSRFDPILILGHPLLRPTSPSRGVYTGNILFPFYEEADEKGACREFNTAIEIQTFFGPVKVCRKLEELSTTSATSSPGNSGSPVLNSDGEVIGVINSGQEDNSAMFIPLVYVREILEE